MFRFCLGALVCLLLCVAALSVLTSIRNADATNAVRYGVQFVCWFIALMAVVGDSYHDDNRQAHENGFGNAHNDGAES